MQALIARLDPENTARLHALAADLVPHSRVDLLPGYYPHLTFATAKAFNPEAVAQAFEAAQGHTTGFRLSGLHLFPKMGTITAMVVKTEALIALQQTLYRYINEAAVGAGDFYLEHHWAPHITLAARIPHGRMPSVVASLAHLELNGSGWLTSLVYSVDVQVQPRIAFEVALG